MPTTYALLVGIDAYPAEVPALSGCVADVEAMHGLLAERVPGVQIRLLVDAAATRDGVISAFRDHLGRAGAGDVAIFWYSGHGSQQLTASAPGVEPDGLDETLVLVDSRTGGGAYSVPSAESDASTNLAVSTDLADKELGALIAEVAARGAQVFVGLDCCHSGSGTRELLPQGAQVRRAPTARAVRPRGTYLTTATPAGRHVLLAACRSDQTAKEVSIAGRHRGALTAAFERTLRGAGPDITYRDLHRSVRAAVAAVAWDQVPQLEVTVDADALGVVLAGRLAIRPQHYLLSRDGADWILDAGAVHGIPASQGPETTVLDVFPPDADLTPSTTAIATARVLLVQPQCSIVGVTGALDPARTYPALVSAWPQPRLPVDVPTGPWAEALRSLLVGSPYVTPTTERQATLAVRRADPGFDIFDSTRGAEAVTRVSNETQTRAALEQIARWRQLDELINPASAIAPGSVRVDLAASGQAIREAGRIVLPYQAAGAALAPQRFRATVTNTTERTVYCALLALDEQYGIATLLPGNVTRLAAGEQVTSPAIEARVPDPFWQGGVLRRYDRLKLLACTEEFDPVVVAQGGLPRPEQLAPRDRTTTRGPTSTFDRLLRRVQRRELAIVDHDEPVVDWTTYAVTVISERPRAVVPVRAGAKLAPGVALQTVPEGFTAGATLTSTAVVARDVVAPLVPPLLVDQAEAWAPYTFGAARGPEAALDVLELRDVEGADLVTPEHPLVLALPEPLAAGESMLAFAWDGENYLPVGRLRGDSGPRNALYIEALPPAINTKSLRGSIRLLCRRFRHKLAGEPGSITRLAVATLGPEGVRYDDDLAAVRNAVARSTRVVLLVHGILGDTEGMVEGGLGMFDGVAGYATGYDAVLAFDYENINTTIDETASQLLAKLRAAGVGDPHVKRFDVVAHSMGGLVSRWLLEKLGDDAMVDRLIMAGTPNGGSPWPVIEDWAIIVLTLGVNGLAHVLWPVKVMSWLLTAVERVDSALDDMAPGSQRLQALYLAADPDRPYYLLVGNRALVVPPHDGGRVARIVDRLKRRSIDAATYLAFLRQVNDLAVSKTSAEHLPAGWSHRPIIHEVACDHVTFFSSPAGRTALIDAAGAGPSAG